MFSILMQGRDQDEQIQIAVCPVSLFSFLNDKGNNG